VPAVGLTAKTPSASATGSTTAAQATLTNASTKATGNTTAAQTTETSTTTKPPGTSNGAQTSLTSASTKSPGITSGVSSIKSSRLENTVAGLKRKKLHADNAGGDTPLLRKVRSKITCHL
jgi:hypothetical protein